MQILNEEFKSPEFQDVTPQSQKRKGVLKTIKGVVADSSLNRNR